jgi:hypothetical protein
MTAMTAEAEVAEAAVRVNAATSAAGAETEIAADAVIRVGLGAVVAAAKEGQTLWQPLLQANKSP